MKFPLELTRKGGAFAIWKMGLLSPMLSTGCTVLSSAVKIQSDADWGLEFAVHGNAPTTGCKRMCSGLSTLRSEVLGKLVK